MSSDKKVEHPRIFPRWLQLYKKTDKSVGYVGEEEKTFLHPLRFFSWRPVNQSDKRQINKRKKPDLIMYIRIGVHKEMWFKKMFRIGGLHTILTDQASNCREITRQRKRGLGLLEGVNYEKVTRKCVVNKGCLARSVMKTSLLFLGREKTYLQMEICVTLIKRNGCPALRQKGRAKS